jgi:hypothetical protein
MKMKHLACALAAAVLVLPRATLADPATYSVLYDFDGSFGVGGPNGGPPLAAPTLAANGDLYGPAGGGIGNSVDCSGPCGVIFKLSHGGNGRWSESVALNFSTYFDLAVPNSPVAFDGRGNLYGSLEDWVFEATPDPGGWGFNLIYHDNGSDVGGVVADSAGNLYGALAPASSTRGAIGRLSPGSSNWRYTHLHNLCGKNGLCPNGGDPRAPLTWDAEGNLYGTDYAGGRGCSGSGCGVAFRMLRRANGSWRYQVLHRFGAFKRDGTLPWGELIVDRSGDAYGTTTGGGPHGMGSIFELSPTTAGTWKETLLYGFANAMLGASPWGTLAFDAAGNLYGVANGGNVCGIYYCGEIYELTPQQDGRWAYSVLHDFTGPDGEYPYGIVIDKHGRLFGTALGGGTYGYGVVFELTPRLVQNVKRFRPSGAMPASAEHV